VIKSGVIKGLQRSLEGRAWCSHDMMMMFLERFRSGLVLAPASEMAEQRKAE
jgi:hypothetical protein